MKKGIKKSKNEENFNNLIEFMKAHCTFNVYCSLRYMYSKICVLLKH